ncbi:response regulator [Pseudoxanthomonas sp. KAs_5_3]|uniref:response regulator n=2 Tax=unclassified Pseudoxanthomonas TaxID=2645906 RepID=UPI0008E7091E|nr:MULTISPECIES: response regulator [unclassified Pseudoxanthomonas]SFV30732.1 Response regulator receiver domain-containing protein [Pseudoxanthomonas sp. YR558]
MPRVLLVEDEADLLSLVSESLDLHGMTVIQATSGSEAFDALRGGEPFDAVISDIAMPGELTGIDVAQEAIDTQPGVRVILTSGHPLSHFPPIPKSAQFLSKPYRVRQLVDLLRALPR